MTHSALAIPRFTETTLSAPRPSVVETPLSIPRQTVMEPAPSVSHSTPSRLVYVLVVGVILALAAMTRTDPSIHQVNNGPVINVIRQDSSQKLEVVLPPP